MNIPHPAALVAIAGMSGHIDEHSYLASHRRYAQEQAEPASDSRLYQWALVVLSFMVVLAGAGIQQAATNETGMVQASAVNQTHNTASPKGSTA